MKKYRTLIASVIVTTGLIGGALYLRTQQVTPHVAEAASGQHGQQTLTLTQLTTFDGKNGHKCYVAVDSTIYEIEQGRLWSNGEHTTSNGQAYCGRDLTQAISQSPHGKSKLTTLEAIGRLQK